MFSVVMILLPFSSRNSLIVFPLTEGGGSSGLKTTVYNGGSGVEKRTYTHGGSYATASK